MIVMRLAGCTLFISSFVFEVVDLMNGGDYPYYCHENMMNWNCLTLRSNPSIM